jgi:hypothetical protein
VSNRGCKSRRDGWCGPESRREIEESDELCSAKSKAFRESEMALL